MSVGAFHCGLAALLIACTAGAADAESVSRGKDFFQETCALCHTAAPVAGGNQGPPLNGIVGRKAATVAGFAYSDALIAFGKVWDAKTLDAYFADPPGFIPGTKMPINVADAPDRADLIAFLATTK
jgi:cytochrome c2